jgi:AcrR family transcriptional regulator
VSNVERTSSSGDTRERILEHAADLFAARGYHGTSTREIASRVGIRQPSLFHHFASKRHILAELLERDLVPTLQRLRRNEGSEPAVRLYAYLLEDVAALVEYPFDVRGLYNDEVLAMEGFAPQSKLRHDLREETAALIAAGTSSGVFREIDPHFARRVVTGMLLDTIWASSTREGAENRPAEVADFVTLGMLRDRGELDRIRREARALLSG